ncbi:hypothetical protein GCM10028857_26820 [Salinarchaeum chitinilyticum]
MAALERYQGRSIESIISESIPRASIEDEFVFLMGPYRQLDPSYLYPADRYPLPPDPLAPKQDDVAPDVVERTLQRVAERVSNASGVTAFIATDIDHPTRQTVAIEDLDEPGMPVIDQSIAFARASDGCAFVFTKAGFTTGTGAEADAIPEHFRLRSADDRRRDPRCFCCFMEARRSGSAENYVFEYEFTSASIDEMDDAYGLRHRPFVDRDHLVDGLVQFAESYVVPLAR